MMNRHPPGEVFCRSPVAAIVVDSRGFVRECNDAFCELFQIDRQSVEGQACSCVVGFLDIEGNPFCPRGRCPVREETTQGRLCTLHEVRHPRVGNCRQLLDLLSVPLAHPEHGAPPVLHLIFPLSLDQADGWLDAAAADSVARRDATALTTREKQVLGLLAAGRDTGEIAEQLFISRTTVRNHIQHILQKSHVHSRLDAVMMWIREIK